jgi:hypothetical protein
MVAHSTLEWIRPCGTKVIRYQATDIVELAPDGSVTIHMGGFNTVTTRSRINQWLDPGWVSSAKGQAFYCLGGRRYAFGDSDHLTLAPDGAVAGADMDALVEALLAGKVDHDILTHELQVQLDNELERR